MRLNAEINQNVLCTKLSHVKLNKSLDKCSVYVPAKIIALRKLKALLSLRESRTLYQLISKTQSAVDDFTTRPDKYLRGRTGLALGSHLARLAKTFSTSHTKSKVKTE